MARRAYSPDLPANYSETAKPAMAAALKLIKVGPRSQLAARLASRAGFQFRPESADDTMAIPSGITAGKPASLVHRGPSIHQSPGQNASQPGGGAAGFRGRRRAAGHDPVPQRACRQSEISKAHYCAPKP